MTAFARAAVRVLGLPMRPVVLRLLSATVLCSLLALVFFGRLLPRDTTAVLAPSGVGRGSVDGVVNVMFAVSGSDMFAVAGCMRSIFANSSTPAEKICIHVAVETSAGTRRIRSRET